MGLGKNLVQALFKLRGGHYVQLATEREHYTPGFVPAIDRKLGRDGWIVMTIGSHGCAMRVHAEDTSRRKPG